MSAEIFQIHDENEFIDRVLGAKYPVLVGFFAPYCDACASVCSRTEQILEDKHEKIYLAKVNIADHYDLCQKCDIKAGPVLAIASNGDLQKKLSGVHETEEIKKFIEEGGVCEPYKN
ncbi:hypothetical protein PVAND_017503 [Polypedilum vanderplanki]|uniref:Thioredoxin n=1 Tax=Polypedilum vanderplanki TaxID=319348 RepID=S6BEM8_POLVA|nr:hypothetical protein PVAND_017503 [Polypedilum vanderplanki]BAN67611.1 thioredoxin [Polypedilum vanderplanki]